MPVGGIEIAARGETPGFLQIEIPPDLASIEEIYEAPPKVDPKLIIHVQNIHADYQAQAQIRKLLQYLHKQYGFKLLFVEGAADKLDPEYLKLYQDSKKNVELADSMAKNGELTGVDYYLTDSPEEVQAFGIEDPQLYRQNFEAFKKAHALKEDSERFMGEYDEKLNSISSKVFPQEARRLLVEWKKFESGHRDFLPYLKRLSVDAKNILGLDLESLFAQVEWPQITRLLALQSMEPDVNVDLAQKEKLAVIDFLQAKRVSPEIINAIKKLDTKKITMSRLSGSEKLEDLPRYLFERLAEEAGPKGFYFRDFPHFSLWAGHLILQNELDSRGLFEEIELLFSKILDDLTQSERQRDLLELYRDSILLRKLFALELTRKEWDRVLYRRDWIEIDAMKRRLNKINQAVSKMAMDSYEVPKESVHNPKTSKVDRALEAGFQFYDFARKRESAFYDTIKKQMAAGGMEKAVLVTGGFHTDGLLEMFREEEINCGILIPKLNGAVDTSNYVSGLLDNKSSLYDFATMELTSRLIPEVFWKGMTGNAAAFKTPLERFIQTATFPTEQAAESALQYLNDSKFGREFMPFTYVVAANGVFIRPKAGRELKRGYAVDEKSGLLVDSDQKFLKLGIHPAGQDKKDKKVRFSGSLVPVDSVGEMKSVAAVPRQEVKKVTSKTTVKRSELRNLEEAAAKFDPLSEIKARKFKVGDPVISGDGSKVGLRNTGQGKEATDWIVAEMKKIALDYVLDGQIPAYLPGEGSDEFIFAPAISGSGRQELEPKINNLFYGLEKALSEKFKDFRIAVFNGHLTPEQQEEISEKVRIQPLFIYSVGIDDTAHTIVTYPGELKNVIEKIPLGVLWDEAMPIPYIPLGVEFAAAEHIAAENDSAEIRDEKFKAISTAADRVLEATKDLTLEEGGELINYSSGDLAERRKQSKPSLEPSFVDDYFKSIQSAVIEADKDAATRIEKLKKFPYETEPAYGVVKRSHLGALLRDLVEGNRRGLQDGVYLVRGPPNLFYTVIVRDQGQTFDMLKIDTLFFSKNAKIHRAFMSILEGGREVQRTSDNQEVLGFKAPNTAFGHDPAANALIKIIRYVIQQKTEAAPPSTDYRSLIDAIAERLNAILGAERAVGIGVRLTASQISKEEALEKTNLLSEKPSEKPSVGVLISSAEELLELRKLKLGKTDTEGHSVVRHYRDYRSPEARLAIENEIETAKWHKAERALKLLLKSGLVSNEKMVDLEKSVETVSAEPVSPVSLTKRSELRIHLRQGVLSVDDTGRASYESVRLSTSRLSAILSRESLISRFVMANSISEILKNDQGMPVALRRGIEKIGGILEEGVRKRGGSEPAIGSSAFYRWLLSENLLMPKNVVTAVAGGIGPLGVQTSTLQQMVDVSAPLDKDAISALKETPELAIDETYADVLMVMNRAPQDADFEQVLKPLAAMLLSQINTRIHIVFRQKGLSRTDLKNVENEYRRMLERIKGWKNLKDGASLSSRLEISVLAGEDRVFGEGLRRIRQRMQKGSKIPEASRSSQSSYFGGRYAEIYNAQDDASLNEVASYGDPRTRRLGLASEDARNVVSGGYLAMRLAQELKDSIAVYLKESRNAYEQYFTIDTGKLAALFETLNTAIKAITRIRSSA